MSEEKTMHLGVTSDQVGKYVFLPGSVERASLIAKHFDNSVKIAHNREYLTYTGTLEAHLPELPLRNCIPAEPIP